MIFRLVLVRSFLIALALWALLASAAFGAERFTVVLKDGTRYENVTYRLRPDFNVLEIDRTHNVSYSDVQAIYDADGIDIAREVLGKGYRPVTDVPEPLPDTQGAPAADGDSLSPEPAAAGVEPPAAPPPARPWSVVATLAGRLDLPFGDYYDGTDGGLGFGGTVHVRLTRDIALRGSIDRLGVDFEKNVGLISYDPALQIVSQDYRLDATRYMGGIEYYKALHGSADWGFWFVHASLGAIRHEVEGEIVIYDTTTTQTTRSSARDTDTRFAQEAGVGVAYGLSDRVGLLFAGELDFVWGRGSSEVFVYSYDSDTIRGSIVGARFGVAVRL